jgi:molybdopterin synthase sulfur carrier subunit
MAAVTVRMPSLLADVGDGRTAVAVEADTARGALDALFAALPQLRVHVFDEAGEIRPHVALFHNGRSVPGSGDLDAPVAAGDVVRILQAVSGG